VGSPGNSFIRAISGAQGLAGSGPTTPQTDAALSPRLLDILQCHEPTHKRTLSDATPLNDSRRTVVGSLPERPASTVGYQTPGQYPTNGIMQQLDRGQNGQSIPSPTRSDTTESDVWHTAPTTQHQGNLNQVSKPVDSARNSPGSTLAIPKTSVRMDGSIPSNTSSFTAVDGSEHQNHTSADVGTSRRAHDVINNQRVEDLRNDRAVYGSDSRGNRRDSDARKPGPQQPGRHPDRPPRLGRTYDPPIFTSVKTERAPAVPNLKQSELESAPSRNSSRTRGECTIPAYDHVLWLT
jgi:hypothetical protein